MLGKLKFGKKYQVKLLGITIDNELKFDDHITKICRKANSKLSALSRYARYLSIKQKKLLYTSFIEAQFKYCSVTWIFCSRSCNKKINKLQERALRLVYDIMNRHLMFYLIKIKHSPFIIKIFRNLINKIAIFINLK